MGSSLGGQRALLTANSEHPEGGPRQQAFRALAQLPPSLLTALVLLGAVSATAQEQAVALPPWRLEVTAGIGTSDNIRFTPSLESSSSGRLRASLTRSVRRPRTTFVLGAAGDGRYYRSARDLNGVNYSADASASYLFSPRTTLRLSDSFTQGFTDESRLLLEAGLFLPRAVARSNNASIEAQHQASPSWSWTASLQHQLVRFNTNSALGESGFVGRAGFSWTAARDFPVSLSYEFGRATPRGRPALDRHGANLRAERRMSERTSARLELGAQRLLSAGDDVDRTVVTSAVGFAIRSQKQTIDAALTRSVNQAFGLGRLQQRSTALLRVTRTLVSRLVLGVNASLSRSVDPAGNARLTFDTVDVGADLGYSLGERVELLGTYGYRSLEPSMAERTRSRFATVSVRVGQNW
jgi:hypothetical protein